MAGSETWVRLHWTLAMGRRTIPMGMWTSEQGVSPRPHQRLRSRLMVLDGMNRFALKKRIRLESFQSTRVFTF